MTLQKGVYSPCMAGTVKIRVPVLGVLIKGDIDVDVSKDTDS